MGFACPNCGGSVIYDIPSGKMKCEHCGSTFEVSQFRVQDTREREAEDSRKAEDVWEEAGTGQRDASKADAGRADAGVRFRRYVCRNCGAQIESLETDLVAYCQYCGGEVVLADDTPADGSGSPGKMPQKMIPFTISRKQAINRYQQFIKSCHFLPEEFKDPDFLKKFTGIYIPEWTYQTRFQGNMPFTFESRRQLSYDYGEIIRGRGEVSLSGQVEETRDASSRLDDAIVQTILPAKITGTVDFLPGYMAGFYADVPDVPPATYQDMVVPNAQQLVLSKARAAAQQRCEGSASIRMDPASLPAPEVSATGSLLPVWFLTWKRDDRVAYSVMNGQSGECYADMPVSVRAFVRASAILAAVIAAILLVITHFVLLTPDVLLYLALYLGVISSSLYESQIRDIACRENHVFDLGFQGSTRMKKAKMERLRRKAQGTLGGAVSGIASDAWHWIGFFVVSLIALGPVISAASSHVTDRDNLLVGALVFWIITLVRAVQIALWAKDTSKPIFGIGGILLQIIPFIGMILLGSIQNDLPFYILTIAVLVLMIFQIILLADYYNMLSTRPVPGFHTGRKGGIDENA